MRRFARWLLIAFTALSLVLFLLTAAAWVTKRGDALVYRRADLNHSRESGACPNSGGISLFRDVATRKSSDDKYFEAKNELAMVFDSPAAPFLSPDVFGKYGEFLGVRWGSDTLSFSNSLSAVFIPFWWLLLLTLPLPLTAVWRQVRRRRRRTANLCAACGYDLRATLGRCPECGAVPAENGV